MSPKNQKIAVWTVVVLFVLILPFLIPVLIFTLLWKSRLQRKIKIGITTGIIALTGVVALAAGGGQPQQSSASNTQQNLSQTSEISSSKSEESSSSQSSSEEFVQVSSKTEVNDLGLAAQDQVPNIPVNGGNQKLYNVLEVVDGDTIKISELGTLRLIGIDTPETKDPRKSVQCFGLEASNNAKNQLAGKKVYLEYDPSNRVDKYNRTLAYVYREDGYFYNRQAIADGFAFSYKSFSHPRLSEFNQIEQQAKSSGAGLWNANTCNGTASPVAVRSTAPAPVITKPIPAPTPQPQPAQEASVYYANCDAVRAAGKAPLFRGQPGYRLGLDRDNDGIGCDK